ncbi:MAG: hypothetical protein U0610_15980 [bacterium]
MAFGDARKAPEGAATLHLGTPRASATSLAKPLEERWCDAFEAACAAVRRQHALNRKLYPKQGPPKTWSQPAPPEPSLFEATISLVCFVEGLIEGYIHVRHGQLDVLRWVHAVFATAASKVQSAAESGMPNTSGFTDVPHELVAAGETLSDLFAAAPLDPFRPIAVTPALTIDASRLRPSTWVTLIELYDALGMAAFGGRAEWAARGRTSDLLAAWTSGFPRVPG